MAAKKKTIRRRTFVKKTTSAKTVKKKETPIKPKEEIKSEGLLETLKVVHDEPLKTETPVPSEQHPSVEPVPPTPETPASENSPVPSVKPPEVLPQTQAEPVTGTAGVVIPAVGTVTETPANTENQPAQGQKAPDQKQNGGSTPVNNSFVPASQTSEPHAETEHEGMSKLKFFLMVFFAVLLVAVVVMGAYVYIQDSQKKSAKKSAITSVLPSPTSSAPTATTLTVNKKAFSIVILNGSGIAGEAGKEKALLEQEGYVVSSVGNAETSDNKTTKIQAKSDVPKAWVTTLKMSLEKRYTDVVIQNASQSASANVTVTLGSGQK